MTPTWESKSGAVKGWLDRTGGVRIRHEDGTETYLQPGDDTNDLIATLNACGADKENIGVLLCDMLEGIDGGGE